MLKILGYVFLGVVLLVAIGATVIVGKFNKSYFGDRPNYLSYTHDTIPMKFEWTEDGSEEYFEPHGAMVFIARIEGVSRKFSLQFDTGSPHSYVYGRPLESLIAHGLEVDTIQEKNKMVKGFQLSLGGNNIDISSMVVKENYGSPINWEDTTTVIGLGTIGADFIDGKVTMIDFKNQRINIYEDRPDWMTTLPAFKDFEFNGRRVMLPSTIGGRKRLLLYDSGCSAFGLITSKNRYKKYTDKKEKEIEYDASRWGDSLPIHHKATKTRLLIGGQDLPLRRISYVDMYASLQRFMTPFTRIGGWLGNKPFIEGCIILDTRKEEFLVIESTVDDA